MRRFTTTLLAALCLCVFVPSAARAEAPARTQADARGMTATIKSKRDAVVLLTNNHGSKMFGTGFVISKKHRLVATNAHVADLYADKGTMLALRNGSDVAYKVDQVYYHPKLNRIGKGNKLLSSTDPKDGKVVVRGPDVAVVHLADDGQDIPNEFELASWEEIADLMGEEVGMIGFPGHDMDRTPEKGTRAVASIRSGRVSLLTDYWGDAGVDAKKTQFMQYTQANWWGFSGSPVFLAGGKVVALNNSMRFEMKDVAVTDESGEQVTKTLVRDLSQGVRVDVLWELLDHHGLAGKVPGGTPKSRKDMTAKSGGGKTSGSHEKP